MSTGTILDMFNPSSAETIGTMRVERIANEPYDQQIRNAGMSVLDALLSSARDKVVELASGTAVGQDLIRTAQQQQQQQTIAQYGPLILVSMLILVFMFGLFLRR